MTGSLPGAPGLVSSPGYAFNGAPKTGFFLAGTNQIGWAANGVQGASFNADTSVTFAGKISAAQGTIPIGAVIDFAGSTAPAGWLLCFGQLVSTTTYAALFAVLGTTYGSGGGTFGIPDYRGRTTFGQDNMGGVAANRITVAGGNFDGTVLGGTGGGQNQALTAAQIPTINTSGVNLITVNPGNNPTIFTPIAPAGFSWVTATGNLSAGGNSFPITSNNGSVSATNSFAANNTITASSTNTGSGVHPIINPAIITNKIVYAGV